jgi:hypothetical protein
MFKLCLFLLKIALNFEQILTVKNAKNKSKKCEFWHVPSQHLSSITSSVTMDLDYR